MNFAVIPSESRFKNEYTRNTRIEALTTLIESWTRNGQEREREKERERKREREKERERKEKRERDKSDKRGSEQRRRELRPALR